MPLLAEGKVERVVAELVPLHEDPSLIHGPDHEETQEIAEALIRLGRAGGATD